MLRPVPTPCVPSRHGLARCICCWQAVVARGGPLAINGHGSGVVPKTFNAGSAQLFRTVLKLQARPDSSRSESLSVVRQRHRRGLQYSTPALPGPFGLMHSSHILTPQLGYSTGLDSPCSRQTSACLVTNSLCQPYPTSHSFQQRCRPICCQHSRYKGQHTCLPRQQLPARNTCCAAGLATSFQPSGLNKQHNSLIRAAGRARNVCCAAGLPPFAALSNLWQSWQPWSAWAAALAAAAAVFLAVKGIFDTPSRTYDTNVGEVYDDWTDEGVLEYFWGEHIHLGYYSSQEQQKAWKQPIWTGRYPKNFKQAKFDFIDEMLAWSQSEQPSSILDVGCGIGGTSRHLAAKFPNAKVTGKAANAKHW